MAERIHLSPLERFQNLKTFKSMRTNWLYWDKYINWPVENLLAEKKLTSMPKLSTVPEP